jgi:A/G-specific adenine glycosylase
MEPRYFSKKVVEWYQLNRRALPWRDTTDPFRIWLSEIILQQTRVNQGLPYYEKFIESFPSVKELASAREQKVLRLWQGLGYYTRARNLHKCAKEIVKVHKGSFPDSYSELLKLPGIGEYTAAAIASISFNEPVAVVDGNVYRVLSRVFGISTEINSPAGKKEFTALANRLIDKKTPALFNQAVMEFGALFCKPMNPTCETCTFSDSCFAFKNDLIGSLPVKKKNKPARKRYFYYFVVQTGNSLLMGKRGEKDIWEGLYDFYLVEKTRPTHLDKLFDEDPFLRKLKPTEEFEVVKNFKHLLSHQTIIATFIHLKTAQKPLSVPKTYRFFRITKVSSLPKSTLIERYLQKTFFFS